MKLYLFSKTECGPCILVKKYFKAMSDSRTDSIEEVYLDEGCSEENLEFARKYKVTATPVLIVVDENGEKIEDYEGGVPITKNIVKLLDQYV
jgi:thioredoxin-related protein